MEEEKKRQHWCKRVEESLSRSGAGLASRFHVAGHEVNERQYGIERIRLRLQVLADIIKELEQAYRA